MSAPYQEIRVQCLRGHYTAHLCPGGSLAILRLGGGRGTSTVLPGSPRSADVLPAVCTLLGCIHLPTCCRRVNPHVLYQAGSPRLRGQRQCLLCLMVLWGCTPKPSQETSSTPGLSQPPPVLSVSSKVCVPRKEVPVRELVTVRGKDCVRNSRAFCSPISWAGSRLSPNGRRTVIWPAASCPYGENGKKVPELIHGWDWTF